MSTENTNNRAKVIIPGLIESNDGGYVADALDIKYDANNSVKKILDSIFAPPTLRLLSNYLKAGSSLKKSDGTPIDPITIYIGNATGGNLTIYVDILDNANSYYKNINTNIIDSIDSSKALLLQIIQNPSGETLSDKELFEKARGLVGFKKVLEIKKTSGYVDIDIPNKADYDISLVRISIINENALNNDVTEDIYFLVLRGEQSISFTIENNDYVTNYEYNISSDSAVKTAFSINAGSLLTSIDFNNAEWVKISYIVDMVVSLVDAEASKCTILKTDTINITDVSAIKNNYIELQLTSADLTTEFGANYVQAGTVEIKLTEISVDAKYKTAETESEIVSFNNVVADNKLFFIKSDDIVPLILFENLNETHESKLLYVNITAYAGDPNFREYSDISYSITVTGMSYKYGDETRNRDINGKNGINLMNANGLLLHGHITNIRVGYMYLDIAKDRLSELLGENETYDNIISMTYDVKILVYYTANSTTKTERTFRSTILKANAESRGKLFGHTNYTDLTGFYFNQNSYSSDYSKWLGKKYTKGAESDISLLFLDADAQGTHIRDNDGLTFVKLSRGISIKDSVNKFTLWTGESPVFTLGLVYSINDVGDDDVSYITFSQPTANSEFKILLSHSNISVLLGTNTVSTDIFNKDCSRINLIVMSLIVDKKILLKIYIDGTLCAFTKIDNNNSFEIKTDANSLSPLTILAGKTDIYKDFSNTDDVKVVSIGDVDIYEIYAYQNIYLSNDQILEHFYEGDLSKNIDVLTDIFFIKNIGESERKNNSKKVNTDFKTLHSITKKYSTGNELGSKDALVNCTMLVMQKNDGAISTVYAYPNVDVFLLGTSSLAYPVKNYQIKVYSKDKNDEGKYDKYKIIPPINPKVSFTEDYIFTLKCDYMESSHRNNTPTAEYYNDVVLPEVVKTLTNTSSDAGIVKFLSPARLSKPASSDNPGNRDAICGYPCRVYYSDNDGESKFSLLSSYISGTYLDSNTNLYKFSDDSYNIAISIYDSITNVPKSLAGSFMFNVDKEGDLLGFKIKTKNINDSSNFFKYIQNEYEIDSTYRMCLYRTVDYYCYSNTEKLKYTYYDTIFDSKNKYRVFIPDFKSVSENIDISIPDPDDMADREYENMINNEYKKITDDQKVYRTFDIDGDVIISLRSFEDGNVMSFKENSSFTKIGELEYNIEKRLYDSSTLKTKYVIAFKSINKDPEAQIETLKEFSTNIKDLKITYYLKTDVVDDNGFITDAEEYPPTIDTLPYISYEGAANVNRGAGVFYKLDDNEIIYLYRSTFEKLINSIYSIYVGAIKSDVTLTKDDDAEAINSKLSSIKLNNIIPDFSSSENTAKKVYFLNKNHDTEYRDNDILPSNITKDLTVTEYWLEPSFDKNGDITNSDYAYVIKYAEVIDKAMGTLTENGWLDLDKESSNIIIKRDILPTQLVRFFEGIFGESDISNIFNDNFYSPFIVFTYINSKGLNVTDILPPISYYTKFSENKDLVSYKYVESTLEPRASYTEDYEDNDEYYKLTYKNMYDIIVEIDEYATNIFNEDNPKESEYLDDFREYFLKNFNYQYAMTYFLQMIFFALIDNAGKNAMFDYWGGLIYIRPYDMDTQMGLNNVGVKSIPVSAELHWLIAPAESECTASDSELDGKIPGQENFSNIHSSNAPRYKRYNSYESNLWKTFYIAFEDDISKCYRSLRQKGVYSFENIMRYVNGKTCDVIKPEDYNNDADMKYLALKDNQYSYCAYGDRKHHYARFLYERIYFLDSFFAYAAAENNNSTYTTVSMRAYTPNKISTITMKPRYASYVSITIGTSEHIMRGFIDPKNTFENNNGFQEYGSRFNFYISSDSEKEILISGCGVLSEIHGIEYLGLGSQALNLSTFNNLKNFKLNYVLYSSSAVFLGIVLGKNQFLSELTFTVDNASLTVQNNMSVDLLDAENIRKIDLSGNKMLTSIRLPDDSPLELINILNTNISYLKLANLKYIYNIETSFNDNPSNGVYIYGTPILGMEISACPKIENLRLNDIGSTNLPLELNIIANTNLLTVEITNCKNLDLTSMRINNCSKLKSISLKQSTVHKNNYETGSVRWLDLSTLKSLQYLNLENLLFHEQDYKRGIGIVLPNPEYNIEKTLDNLNYDKTSTYSTIANGVIALTKMFLSNTNIKFDTSTKMWIDKDTSANKALAMKNILGYLNIKRSDISAISVGGYPEALNGKYIDEYDFQDKITGAYLTVDNLICGSGTYQDLSSSSARSDATYTKSIKNLILNNVSSGKFLQFPNLKEISIFAASFSSHSLSSLFTYDRQLTKINIFNPLYVKDELCTAIKSTSLNTDAISGEDGYSDNDTVNNLICEYLRDHHTMGITTLDSFLYDVGDIFLDLINSADNVKKLKLLKILLNSFKNILSMNSSFRESKLIGNLSGYFTANNSKNILNMSSAFLGSSVTKIFNNEFKYMYSLTNINSMFWGCSNLTEIHEDLFEYVGIAKYDGKLSLDCAGLFNGCSNLRIVKDSLRLYRGFFTTAGLYDDGTYVPTDSAYYMILNDTTNANSPVSVDGKNERYIFRNCSKIKLDRYFIDKVLRSLKRARSISGIFFGCSIKEGLYDEYWSEELLGWSGLLDELITENSSTGRSSINIKYMDGIFAKTTFEKDDTNISTTKRYIPKHLFSKKVKCSDNGYISMRGMFSKSDFTGYIDADFLYNCPKISSSGIGTMGLKDDEAYCGWHLLRQSLSGFFTDVPLKGISYKMFREQDDTSNWFSEITSIDCLFMRTNSVDTLGYSSYDDNEIFEKATTDLLSEEDLIKILYDSTYNDSTVIWETNVLDTGFLKDLTNLQTADHAFMRLGVHRMVPEVTSVSNISYIDSGDGRTPTYHLTYHYDDESSVDICLLFVTLDVSCKLLSKNMVNVRGLFYNNIDLDKLEDIYLYLNDVNDGLSKLDDTYLLIMPDNTSDVQIENMSSMFANTNLKHDITGYVFKNYKRLENTSFMFMNSSVDGTVDNQLFIDSRDTIVNTSGMFLGTEISGIGTGYSELIDDYMTNSFYEKMGKYIIDNANSKIGSTGILGKYILADDSIKKLVYDINTLKTFIERSVYIPLDEYYQFKMDFKINVNPTNANQFSIFITDNVTLLSKEKSQDSIKFTIFNNKEMSIAENMLMEDGDIKYNNTKIEEISDILGIKLIDSSVEDIAAQISRAILDHCGYSGEQTYIKDIIGVTLHGLGTDVVKQYIYHGLNEIIFNSNTIRTAIAGEKSASKSVTIPLSSVLSYLNVSVYKNNDTGNSEKILSGITDILPINDHMCCYDENGIKLGFISGLPVVLIDDNFNKEIELNYILDDYSASWFKLKNTVEISEAGDSVKIKLKTLYMKKGDSSFTDDPLFENTLIIKKNLLWNSSTKECDYKKIWYLKEYIRMNFISQNGALLYENISSNEDVIKEIENNIYNKYMIKNQINHGIYIYNGFKLSKLFTGESVSKTEYLKQGYCFDHNKYLYENRELGLFSDCSKLTDVSYMFAACTLLAGSIPADMFKCYNSSKKLTKLNDISSIFAYSSNLATFIDDYDSNNLLSCVGISSKFYTATIDTDTSSSKSALIFNKYYADNNFRFERVGEDNGRKLYSTWLIYTNLPNIITDGNVASAVQPPISRLYKDSTVSLGRVLTYGGNLSKIIPKIIHGNTDSKKDASIVYSEFGSNYLVPEDWLDDAPNISNASHMFSLVGSKCSINKGYMKNSVLIKGMTSDITKKDPVLTIEFKSSYIAKNVDPNNTAEDQLLLLKIPNNIFSKHPKISTIAGAFSFMPSIGLTKLNSNFLNSTSNGVRSLTNASRAFYKSDLSDIGGANGTTNSLFYDHYANLTNISYMLYYAGFSKWPVYKANDKKYPCPIVLLRYIDDDDTVIGDIYIDLNSGDDLLIDGINISSLIFGVISTTDEKDVELKTLVTGNAINLNRTGSIRFSRLTNVSHAFTRCIVSPYRNTSGDFTNNAKFQTHKATGHVISDGDHGNGIVYYYSTAEEGDKITKTDIENVIYPNITTGINRASNNVRIN